MFNAIPGMKIKSSPTGDVLGESTEDGCKADCAFSDRCQSVSYSAPQKLCLTSDESISVGSDWDYFERVGEGHADLEEKQQEEALAKAAYDENDMKSKEYVADVRAISAESRAVQAKLDKLADDWDSPKVPDVA